jgi:diacylglycerol kinase (ATP)
MSKNSKNIAKNPSGWRRLPRATYCSLMGLKAAWVHESSFRQYVSVSALLFPLSFVLAQSTLHCLMLIASLVFLLFSELVNSAIEAVADATKPQYDELIGRAKDLGSAGVFVVLLLNLLIWGVTLYEYARAY